MLMYYEVIRAALFLPPAGRLADSREAPLSRAWCPPAGAPAAGCSLPAERAVRETRTPSPAYSGGAAIASAEAAARGGGAGAGPTAGQVPPRRSVLVPPPRAPPPAGPAPPRAAAGGRRMRGRRGGVGAAAALAWPGPAVRAAPPSVRPAPRRRLGRGTRREWMPSGHPRARDPRTPWAAAAPPRRWVARVPLPSSDPAALRCGGALSEPPAAPADSCGCAAVCPLRSRALWRPCIHAPVPLAAELPSGWAPLCCLPARSPAFPWQCIHPLATPVAPFSRACALSCVRSQSATMLSHGWEPIAFPPHFTLLHQQLCPPVTVAALLSRP